MKEKEIVCGSDHVVVVSSPMQKVSITT